MKTKLHIVIFDQLFPTNYGGIIDVFYRLKAIKEKHYIILHCFYKDKLFQKDYSEVSDEVYFYKRNTSFLKQISLKPFIIKSRENKNLISKLSQDEIPILLEGHHACSVLFQNKINPQRILVRVHNVEKTYYYKLFQTEKNILKKFYYISESFKLSLFEKKLKRVSALFCLHNDDVNHYLNLNKNTFFWRIGVDTNILLSESNILNQVVIIGNLSVNENKTASLHLIHLWEKQKIEHKLIIAGKNPDIELKNACNILPNVELMENPTNETLNKILQSSKYNIAYTFQKTGMKIKIIHNLLRGNVCLANDLMTYNSDVDNLVVKIREEDLKKQLNEISFDLEAINKRKIFVQNLYDASKNSSIFTSYIERLSSEKTGTKNDNQN